MSWPLDGKCFIGSFTFKKSAWKAEGSYEFYPTNLHLQRMWAQNATLRKTNFFDIYTVGAFSAHSLKTKSQGLNRMLKDISAPANSMTEKINLAEEILWSVLKLRRDIIGYLDSILRMCRVKKSVGLGSILETLINKTKQLVEISENALLEEAPSFLESNRHLEQGDRSDSVSAIMERNKSILEQEILSPRNALYQNSSCSVNSSGYLSLDTHSSIETVSGRLCSENMSPPESLPNFSNQIKKTEQQEHVTHMTQLVDNGKSDDNETSVFYKVGEEMEPIDLTRLNIEASLICLSGKLKHLTGVEFNSTEPHSNFLSRLENPWKILM